MSKIRIAIFGIGLVSAVVLLICAVVFFRFINRPQASGAPKEIVIAQGSGFSDVSRELHEKGVISSPTLFSAYLLMTGKYRSLQSGVYQFSSSQPPREIARDIVSGRTSASRVTIIEGWSTQDIAEALEEKEIVTKKDFLAAAKGKEGYLFPDTYHFAHDVTASEVVTRLEETFAKRTKELAPTREQVIIASIVEREAKLDEDRAKIAGVYFNRLRLGMRLEADPTVQYAKGSWDPITVADYRSVISPYNTYLNAGLPPGPIANPGLSSLEAAVHPAETDAVYFFHLKDGTTIYSKTLEEHNQNKQKYKNER